MAIPIGSILEVQIETRANEQRCLNILHYRVTTEGSGTGIQAEVEDFLDGVESVSGIIGSYRALMSTEATMWSISGQLIRNDRYARIVHPIDDPGELSGNCTAQNVSAVITKRTELSGRWAVGSFHAACLPESAYLAGKLKNATLILAQELADDIAETVTGPVRGGVYRPVVLHPQADHGGSTFISGCQAQETLRVVRRRTVGLGI